MNKREINVDEVVEKINKEYHDYYVKYDIRPKVIIVPDYIEYIMRSYLTHTNIRIYSEVDYSTYMGILIIGTKNKKDIKEIEVF